MEKEKEKIKIDRETIKEIRSHMLAFKYWINGDDWDFAKEYADSLVYGWKIRK